MKKKVVLVVAIALFAGLNGCSHMTVLRVQELKAVQSRVDSLHAELTTMQTKLLEEQKTNGEMLRLLRADQQVRFNEIDRKVSALESNLNENQSRLSKIVQNTSEVSKKLEQKLADEAEAANQKKLQIEKLFEIAMSDFNAGRYDMAINGFRDIVRQFPDSPQGPEAEYWTAECFYAKKEYESAERAYLDFIKKYPNGPRFCVSLYKLGLTYDYQSKVKSKDMVWRNLVDKCKDSQEAQVVKTQLGSSTEN